jgi:rhodanese-related sulfurtransferase
MTWMAKNTFGQMVAEATAAVPAVSAAELKQRLEQDSRTLVVDVRDFESRRASGMIPGAVAVSHGALLYKADEEVPPEWREPQLQDRSRPIVTQCDLGPLSAISAKTLSDMGFTNVSYLDGGIGAWAKAGLPVEQAAAK